MRKALGAAIILACGVALGALSASAQQTFVSVREDDAAMNAAIEEARGTIDGFWAKLADPAAGEQHFSIKLGLVDGDATEHVWCGAITIDGDVTTCRIDNEPQTISNVKMGEFVTVDPETISDWMFMRDGLIIGGHTIRAILPTLSEADRHSYEAILGPVSIPD
jgi:uncharacterized protein YegJ (DUF2314 family)